MAEGAARATLERAVLRAGAAVRAPLLVLVTGARGAGKSSALRHLAASSGLKARAVNCRAVSASGGVGALRRLLGGGLAGGEMLLLDDADELAAALLGGDLRVCVAAAVSAPHALPLAVLDRCTAPPLWPGPWH